MKESTSGSRNGIQWTLWTQLDDLDFADDIALVSHNHSQMQDKTSTVNQLSGSIRLRIHPGKSKMLKIKTEDTQAITVGGKPLEVVENFTYLGSVIDHSGGTAADARILRIFWPERIRNEELWSRAGQRPIREEITQRRWRWLGHTLRKPRNSITRQSLQWNPQGKRSRGRPWTTWRRNLEEEMKASGHSWRDITRMAQDRREWSTVVRGLYPLQNIATDVSVQIYVMSFDSLTEISMVNSWWGLPSTVRAISGKELVHPHQSHFLHHYLHLKHSYTGDRARSAGSHSSGAVPDSHYTQSSRHSKGHGISRNGHLFVSVRGGGPKGNSKEVGSYLAWSVDIKGESFEEYRLSIFLRMNWSDSRLVWNNSDITGPLEVDPKLVDMIWAPDLYFLNEKEAIIHDVTVMNNLMHIYKDGTVHTSTRISMTLSCDMHLERYPHDEQTCSIYAGSYSYSKENVVLHWHKYPLQLRPTLTLPRFTVMGHNTIDCEIIDFGEQSMIDGNFSCIQANFFLRRQFGYYIAQVYIPSVLIVVLSWVSFWIDIDAIPARVSLGLLTVLAITTQSTGEKSGLPRVSYIKAIDLWMAVCLMFVFMALLEFSYVNVQCRVQKRRQETIIMEAATNTDGPRNGKERNNLDLQPRSGRRFVFFRDRMKVQRARFVDKCSRVVFPGLFVLFNVCYWLYYQ
ncbi:hypothetical protein RRG08_025437 [Elysia crispata]|uniref:Uncharacterized protein n=1 Tax=Elysia crispata TaxID=231223 RepID=A0AAE0Z8U0_9GAST|nr:hypothetical protein RRG08_025437 [Elysia crispata]